LFLQHLLEIQADERLVLGDDDPDRLAAHGRKPSDVGATAPHRYAAWAAAGHPGTPPYPNRQRERIQNPRSVRSSRTGGTPVSAASRAAAGTASRARARPA